MYDKNKIGKALLISKSFSDTDYEIYKDFVSQIALKLTGEKNIDIDLLDSWSKTVGSEDHYTRKIKQSAIRKAILLIENC